MLRDIQLREKTKSVLIHKQYFVEKFRTHDDFKIHVSRQNLLLSALPVMDGFNNRQNLKREQSMCNTKNVSFCFLWIVT